MVIHWLNISLNNINFFILDNSNLQLMKTIKHEQVLLWDFPVIKLQIANYIYNFYST